VELSEVEDLPLQEVHHPDEPMPPITQFIEKGEAAPTEIPIFDICNFCQKTAMTLTRETMSKWVA
jgi:hypothetical protein